MLLVYKLNIPTPFPVGPVNVYLIKSHPYTLIDTGPDLPDARLALEEALVAYRVSLREIERVVITHCHPEHCGLAALIRETAGAEIMVNGLEAGLLTGERDYFQEILPYLIEAGLPEAIIREVAGDVRIGKHRKLAGEEVLLLTGEEVLGFEDGELIIQNFPGHTQGHICLYDQQTRNFFSGDFLLNSITPNPLIEVGKETGKRLPSKKLYFDGLNRLLKMDITEVWPGHGKNITNWRETVYNVLGHHLQRIDDVCGQLTEKGRTAYEIAITLFPQIKGLRIILGVSEVLASLDILLEKGRAGAEKRNGVIMYHKAGGK